MASTIQRSLLTLALLATIGLAPAGCAGVNGNGDPNGQMGNSDGVGGATVTGTGGYRFPGGTAGRGMGVVVGTGGAGSDPKCGLQEFNLERKPADLFLVLDRSGSMRNDSSGNTPRPPALSKWDQVVSAVTQVVPQSGGFIPWGLKSFPEDGPDCGPGLVTNKIDVPVAPMNTAAINAAIAALTPSGNGTPTGAAVDVAVAYLGSLKDGNAKYILLATDGAPTCSGGVGNLTGNTSRARTEAVAAVTAAATAGIHTFVVGVATTSSNDAATLNNLAIAGLEPRMDPTTKFYLANSQADLVTALKTITGQISSCVFPLKPPPPDPTNIAVKISGTRTPQDPAHQNGWDYTAPDHSGLEVYGPSCDAIKMASNLVQIIYGCPNVPIP